MRDERSSISDPQPLLHTLYRIIILVDAKYANVARAKQGITTIKVSVHNSVRF